MLRHQSLQQHRRKNQWKQKPSPFIWSYEGEGGPEYWGSLEADYAACGEGMEQSPVDIADAPVNPDDVAYAYQDTAVNIVNNGHAIQVNYDEGSMAEIDGTEYALQQFHFHSLSEHTVAGANDDMEMHLVHADADGNNAVISVLIVEGEENPAFAPVWDNMPAEEGDPVTVEGVVVNVDDLLPEDRSYYHYMGSLTTPPCTEGVNWHVLVEPVELSADQLAAFRAIHDGTNRPVQPMNERVFLGPGEAAGEGEAVVKHWSYEGDTGPEYWGSLEADYAACGEGMEQSPVDIADAPVNPDDVAYAYQDTAVNIVNNGHAIQVNYDEGSMAEIDGTEYALQQFHFHSLSEHTVAGANDDMEMHLVHADADGNNAVISVLIVEGEENPAFAPVWDNMPAEEGDPVTVEGVVVNVDDLLPEDRSYYHYMGSLTTPPCTEGVNWHVLVEPVELSADQLAAFRAIHDGTNRPVQPMNRARLRVGKRSLRVFEAVR